MMLFFNSIWLIYTTTSRVVHGLGQAGLRHIEAQPDLRNLGPYCAQA